MYVSWFICSLKHSGWETTCSSSWWRWTFGETGSRSIQIASRWFQWQRYPEGFITLSFSRISWFNSPESNKIFQRFWCRLRKQFDRHWKKKARKVRHVKRMMKAMMMTEGSRMARVMRIREGMVGAGVVLEQGDVGEGVEDAKQRNQNRLKNQQVRRWKEKTQILLPCPLLVWVKWWKGLARTWTPRHKSQRKQKKAAMRRHAAHVCWALHTAIQICTLLLGKEHYVSMARMLGTRKFVRCEDDRQARPEHGPSRCRSSSLQRALSWDGTLTCNVLLDILFMCLLSTNLGPSRWSHRNVQSQNNRLP